MSTQAETTAPDQVDPPEKAEKAEKADRDPALSARAALWARLDARLGHGRQPLYRAMADVIALAIAASLSMAAVVGYFAADQSARNDRLTREISSLDRQLAEVKQLKGTLQFHLATMATIAQLQVERQWPVLDLNAITRALPAGVRLGEIGVDGARVVVRGAALSAARVAALIRELGEAHFGQVRLLRLEAASAGADPEGAVDFVVEMIRQPKREPTHQRAAPEAMPAAGDASAPPIAATNGESPGTLIATLIAALLAGLAVLWLVRRRPATNCAGGARRLLSSLARVDYADPERWPLAARLFFLAEILLLALGAAWWFGLAGQIDALREQAQTEIKLKDDFAAKTTQVAGRVLYSQQLKEIELGTVDRMKLLPNRFDDASLLIELNQSALGRGLTVRRLQPSGAVSLGDASATQSWALELAGDFNDVGAFLADVGRTARLVTFPKYRLAALSAADPTVLLVATLQTHRKLDVEEEAQTRWATRKKPTKEAI